MSDARLSPLPGTPIRVWDPLIRLFHWTLVSSVTICLLLEAGTWYHRGAGYVALGLIAFRLLWGFAGSRHARFAGFVVGPGAIVAYLRSLWRGMPERHLGHNPAGGAMIVLLLLVLAASCLSGALLNTDAFWGDETLEDLHEAVSEALYLLVPVHLLGVVVSSLLHGENLIAAMITGNKKA